MVESKRNPDNKNKNRPDKIVKYLKMKVIENLRSKTINEEIETGVSKGTHVTTDDYRSYKKISETIEHTSHKVDKANVHKILPWVHKAKRLLLDVHHRMTISFKTTSMNFVISSTEDILDSIPWNTYWSQGLQKDGTDCRCLYGQVFKKFIQYLFSQFL
jgi:hypothetical protein